MEQVICHFYKVPLNFQIKLVLWYLFVLTTLHFDR